MKLNRFPIALALAALVGPASSIAALAPPGPEQAAATPEAIEFFEKRVRPLLANRCFVCHSDKQEMPMGGLRVDSMAFLRKGGERGPAIVPGKPDESLLIRAIRFTEPGMQMPPGNKLPAGEIETLTEWVRMGAPWPEEEPPAPSGAKELPVTQDPARTDHWAYAPFRRPQPPAVRSESWTRGPVDRFILSRLEREGVRPAPEADRRTLIRRVTFDLLGLPPTPEEVDAFVADRFPRAYENLVERLLDSPHYGERWARHWLDLVRYAETDGHEFDFEKPFPWRYRDYLIRAFNADVPYDQFVREHVAGDQLPNPRKGSDGVNQSMLATGYWWLGEGKHSPVDLLEDEAERTDNQIDVFGKTFLGLTVGCARCHDHKFDAISAADYYSLSAYLRSSRYAVRSVNDPAPSREAAGRLAKLNSDLEPALLALAAARRLEAVRNLPALLLAARSALAAGGKPEAVAASAAVRNLPHDQVAAWVQHLSSAATIRPDDPLHAWALLARVPDEEFPGRLQGLRDAGRAGRIFEDFSGSSFDGWFVTGEAFGDGPTGRTSVYPAIDRPGEVVSAAPAGSASSARYGYGLTGALRSRTFMLDSDSIDFLLAGRDTKINIIIDGFQRIRNPIYGDLTIDLKEEGPLRWASIAIGKWKGHRAYIEVIDNGAGWIAIDEIRLSDGRPTYARRLPAAAASPEAMAEAFAAEVTSLLRLASEPDVLTKLDEAQLQLLAWTLWAGPQPPAGTAPEADKLLSERLAIERAIPAPVLAMTMTDGNWEEQPIYRRGSPRTPGDLVHARFLEVLGGATQTPLVMGSGRLELANILTSRRNPLLARVMVNRLWHHHFGEGLVRTPDDFGLRGEAPSHPELLEYLCSEFVRSGWSVKQMHRMMVLSSTYRQASSGADARSAGIDPTNRLLSRMPVRRLEAEAIRDAMLRISGRLDPQLFGPPVPPHLTPFMSGRGRPETSGGIDGDGRRSIYVGVRRNFLPPLFLAFDYPIPFNTMGKRSISTVPAQALAMMNNPFVLQQAGVWARRVMEAVPGNRQARIERMYLAAFARSPLPEEERAAAEFVTAREATYGSQDDLRAWSDLAHVLFNTKEFIFAG